MEEVEPDEEGGSRGSALSVVHLEAPVLKHRTASALTVATVAAMEGIAPEQPTQNAEKKLT